MAVPGVCVTRYSSSDRSRWDDFVSRSKNGTFLFSRDYMDYARERFADHSLIFRDKRGRVVALLPANESAGELVSHEGLTYGGLITDDRMRTSLMLAVFDRLLEYLEKSQLSALTYKCVPHIYHQYPAEEDLYALFRAGAHLFRRDVTSSIDLSRRLEFQQRRSRGAGKARRVGLEVGPSKDIAGFWKVLVENLRSVHGTGPVHSLSEIRVLQQRFPRNIRLYTATEGGEVVAGVVLYLSATVLHAQYIASSARGKQVGALDLLFSFLLDSPVGGQSFFDFGISTERQGRYLNEGLMDFKEGFGARAITHDFYKVNVKKSERLERD